MKFIVYFPLTPLKLYTNKKALEADGPQPLLLVPAFKESGKLQLPSYFSLEKGAKGDNTIFANQKERPPRPPGAHIIGAKRGPHSPDQPFLVLPCCLSRSESLFQI